MTKGNPRNCESANKITGKEDSENKQLAHS